MTTLAIERSTAVQSAALAVDGTIVAATVFDGIDARSGAWAPALAAFAGDRRPDRILVGRGPGSFAGIRAALAYAQGYAIGSGCTVSGLPSPAALARADRPTAIVGDARRGLYWVALYEGFRPVGEIFQTGADDLARRVPRTVEVVSPDAARIDAVLREKFESRYLGEALPTAETLLRAALALPEAVKAEPLPIYLNPAVRD